MKGQAGTLSRSLKDWRIKREPWKADEAWGNQLSAIKSYPGPLAQERTHGGNGVVVRPTLPRSPQVNAAVKKKAQQEKYKGCAPTSPVLLPPN